MSDDRMIPIMKAALPYLNPPVRDQLFQFLRFFEVYRTLTRMEQEQEESLSACSLSEEERMDGLFHAIREYLSPQEQESLDLLFNIFQMSRIYQQQDPAAS